MLRFTLLMCALLAPEFANVARADNDKLEAYRQRLHARRQAALETRRKMAAERPPAIYGGQRIDAARTVHAAAITKLQPAPALGGSQYGYYSAWPKQSRTGYYSAWPDHSRTGYYGAWPDHSRTGYYSAWPSHHDAWAKRR